ncbi:MAG: SDR family NAD(P)-dependent oxidoreductase [Bacteroidales bacterium]|jgi:3-oxoacyl-[acyl-carrier-protein] synthase-3|nr:SDR family NAD(P)-dependent oxidoreductase [Bacteroidales bacterium]
MMVESYIFTGFGFCLGSFKVSNDEIYNELKKGNIQGFDEKRILEKYPDLKNPFDFMVNNQMGFKNRFHVVPFPPAKNKYKKSKNSIDLCVEAVDQALNDGNLSGNNIDAWFFSSGTHSQKAPGIGEFVKAYFTDIENITPVYTLTSACVGFNINLEAAIDFFKNNPKAKNIIIAHADVMSELLTEETDFVPFSTFGDSAAAVVLSKIESYEKVGVINVFNGQDILMLDFLGADKKGNLYMNPRNVKKRAIPNITNASKLLLEKSNWKVSDLQFFLPHQTGNAIVDKVAENLQIEKEKVFQEVQINYGNLSGASIPACFFELKKSNRLQKNDKILSAIAGLGGEFGGFSYIVSDFHFENNRTLELSDKTILITGASGGIGSKIAYFAAKKGAKLILLYNSSIEKIENVRKSILSKFPKTDISLIKCDFSIINNIENTINDIKNNFPIINYLIVTHAITGSLNKASNIKINEFEEIMQINCLSIKQLCEGLQDIILESVLITGSIGEEAQFAGSSSYVASKRALKAFSINFAKNIYELKRVNCIYYLPGLIDSGMVEKLNEKQKKEAMKIAGQTELIKIDDIARRMLNSVYRLKIANVRMQNEQNLKVIKDCYFNF